MLRVPSLKQKVLNRASRASNVKCNSTLTQSRERHISPENQQTLFRISTTLNNTNPRCSPYVVNTDRLPPTAKVSLPERLRNLSVKNENNQKKTKHPVVVNNFPFMYAKTGAHTMNRVISLPEFDSRGDRISLDLPTL